MSASREDTRLTLTCHSVPFRRQFAALLERNLLIKWRQKSTLFWELLFPFIIMGIFFLGSPKRSTLEAQNATTIEGPLFSNGSIGFAKTATWYLINDKVLDDKQVQLFSSLLKESQVALNITFRHESDFNEFNANASNNSEHFAIIWNVFNDLLAKYTIRFPYNYVPNGHANEGIESCLKHNATSCPSFLYWSKQFSLVQAMVDNAILNLKSGRKHVIPNFEIGIFPRAKQVDDTQIKIIAAVVPMSFITYLSFTAIQLVKENEKRIKEALFMMGLSGTAYWFSWALVQSLVTLPASAGWTLLLLYLRLVRIHPLLFYLFIQFGALSFTLLAFLISPFFKQTKTVQIFSAIFAITIGGLPFLLLTQLGSSSIIYKLASPFASFPFTASMSDLLSSDEPVTFSNLFTILSFPIGFSLMAIMIDCILYFASTLICDYLIRNSILSKLIDSLMTSKTSNYHEYDLAERSLSFSNVEPISEEFGSLKAIEIKNIVKKFNSKAVIKDITLNVYQSQITALLGPNSAGKTTLISLLTGELKPTSGDVLIYGHSVQSPSDLQKLRTNFGVCLQEDILLDELTSAEHLHFIAKMKGLSDREVQVEMKYMLELMDLKEQVDTQAEHLSGGQKRKLCIAMAVIAGSRILFLDEPTSGIDAYSRRKIWTALQSLKKDRVIILTTHFMDEADILSDRKAFIIDGKVHCVGSSLFLKGKFGVGYHLRVNIKSKNSVPSISTLICNTIPSAQLDRATNSEMIFTLPKNEATNFASLFKLLDESIERKNLGLKDYGISMTSLEDVFLNICQKGGLQQETIHSRDPPRTVSSNEMNTSPLKTLQYSPQFTSALLCFVKIRCLILLRDRSFLYLIIINTILIILFANISLNSKESLEAHPITFNTSVYSQDTLLYRGNLVNDQLRASLSHLCTAKWVDVFNLSSMQDAAYAIDLANATTKPLTIAAIFFQVNHLHALPILQNLVSNILASQWLSSSFQIETINFPLPNQIDSLPIFSFGYIFSLISLYCTLCCTFAVEVVEDRQIQVKAYLRACGMSVSQYWFALLLVHGSIFALILLATTTLSCVVFSLSPLFNDWQFWVCLCLINTLTVPSSLLLSYSLSFIFKHKETAQNGLFYLNFFPTIILCTVFPIFLYNSVKLGTAFFLILLFWPFIGPFVCLFSLFSLSQKRIRQVEISYFEWNQALLSSLIALFLGLVIYSTILYFINWGNGINFRKYFCLKKTETIVPTNTENIDPDVQIEKNRVDQFFERIDSNAPLLLIKDLCKVFANKIAVNSLSLTVEKGQIVSLLGPNGAGKTSIMKILVGDERKTSGHVFMKGQKMEAGTDRATVLSYCPQHNPLWPEITFEEHLWLFCAIRGVPQKQMETTCQRLMEILNIEEHASKRSNCLSGGTKRKLCLLIAVLGKAKICLLDEPSTGMDPKSKRLLWNLVISNFEPNGEKSAILTTHSMEEVEALSTRMLILAKGIPLCLGTIQHLKNKFGSGYILEVAFKANGSLDCEQIFELTRNQLFPSIKIVEKLSNNIKMEVPQNDIPSLAVVFQTLQDWLSKYPDIEEYSFCQSSIERVFIGFAQKDS